MAPAWEEWASKVGVADIADDEPTVAPLQQ
jgi:hypothetical protein